MKRHMQRANGTRAASFLARLRRDQRGNTLAIVGAALIPFTALIGSGVDMSRVYMAKTRLQSACDAASLAARRAMSNDEFTDAVNAEGENFFRFNFPEGAYGTAPIDPVITRPREGTIEVVAETAVPTGVMHVFGFEQVPLQVRCEATLTFVNTDVMLVLDTTGSMLCTPEETGNCGRGSEISTSRIVALRDAVNALYEELEPIQQQLENNGMRLRYGMVPYSSAVNVGGVVMDEDVDSIADTANYQSRSPIYRTVLERQVYNNMNLSTCNGYRRARSPAFPTYPTEETVPIYNGNLGRCTVERRSLTRQITPTFDHWVYEQRAIDTSAFKATLASGSAIAVPTRQPGATDAARWSGCIEERQTTTAINGGTSYTVPDEAFDLDIDLLPTSNETRWKPHWPELIWRREYNSVTAPAQQLNNSNIRSLMVYPSAFRACPSPASALRAWGRSEMATYVDNLVAIGGTYHDIGMIWGARLLSRGGIFADHNPDEFNGMPVARHIIFMTDGDMAPDGRIYGAYGMEHRDNRVGPSGTSTADLTLRHRQRFRMACDAARTRDVTVWVVSFALTPNAGSAEDLLECTGGVEDRVFQVADRDELIERFTEIGRSIGALRLTK